ncbi:hypothetical protein CBL_14338 [Carabus blaptoides fortunei]
MQVNSLNTFTVWRCALDSSLPIHCYFIQQQYVTVTVWQAVSDILCYMPLDKTYGNITSIRRTGRKDGVTALAATLGALAAGMVLGFTSPTEQEYKNPNITGFVVTSEDFKWAILQNQHL